MGALLVLAVVAALLVLDDAAGAAVLGAVALVALAPTARGSAALLPLRDGPAGAWIAWRFSRALAAVDLAGVATVRRAERTAAGWELRLGLARGWTAGALDRRGGNVASAMRRPRCLDVLVDPAEDASRAVATVMLRDPLADAGGLPWPWLGLDRASVWDPVPVAVGEAGEAVTVTLPGRHVLIGGAPGSGKSVAASMLVAAAALDPECRLFLLDGKEVDLAAWEPRAERHAGASVDDAIAVLREVRAEMERRYDELRGQGLRKVPHGHPVVLLVCDELAFYYGVGDRQRRAEFAELLRDLVARGRAAGVVVVAATQKPSADTVPTGLRDLFGYRWALRATTNAMSDTILGSGWAGEGYDASTVAAGRPGEGYVLAEEEWPRRCRAFHLTDEDVDEIAGRVTQLGTPTTPGGRSPSRAGGCRGGRPEGPVGSAAVPAGEGGGTPPPEEAGAVPRPASQKKRSADTEVLLLEHLGPEAQSQGELVRRTGLPPTTARRGLGRLATQGRAVRCEGGWRLPGADDGR